jgi:hypothetical protein
MGDVIMASTDIAPSPLLGLGLAISGGLAGYEEGKLKAEEAFDREEARKVRRAEAQQKKQFMDYKLAEAGRADAISSATHDQQLVATQQALTLQQEQTRSTGTQLFKTDTYNSLDAYFEDYNTRHLNNLIKKAKQNPFAPEVFKDVVRVDPINVQDPKMLQQLGVSPEELQQLDALDGKTDGQYDMDKISKRFVVATMPDGSQQLRDTVMFSTITGYADYARNRQLGELKSLADIRKANKPGSDNSTYTMRDAAHYAKLRQAIESGTATPQQKAEYDWFQQEQGGTAVAKGMNTEDALDTWYTQGFDNLQFEELRRNREAGALVRQIEQTADLKESDRKDLKLAFRQLNTLRSAQMIDPDSMGLIDKIVTGIKNKFSDDAEGKRAAAAYGDLINSVRNDQFGSALTDKEIEAFNAAYGSRSDQMSKVLAGLRAMTENVKANLESVIRLNNDAVTKYRTGYSVQDVENILDNLDKRIGFYSSVENGMSPKEAAERWSLTERGMPIEGSDRTVVPTEPKLPEAPVGTAAGPNDLKAKYGW